MHQNGVTGYLERGIINNEKIMVKLKNLKIIASRKTISYIHIIRKGRRNL